MHILTVHPLVTPGPRGAHTCGMTHVQEARPGGRPIQAVEVASGVWAGNRGVPGTHGNV